MVTHALYDVGSPFRLSTWFGNDGGFFFIQRLAKIRSCFAPFFSVLSPGHGIWFMVFRFRFFSKVGFWAR